MTDIDTDAMQSIGSIAEQIVGGLHGDRIWTGEKITEPGVYAGVDIERYHHDPELFDGFSISSSGLRTLLRRPAEYWWTSPYNPNREEPETKSSLDFGKAAHMLLLGEDGFAERYSLRPAKYPDSKTGEPKAWNANSNWCKAWLTDQAEAGRTVITDTEINHIRHMADALSRKEAIRLGILNGKIERSIFHKDGDIWLKARPDAVPVSSGDYVDLKTAASVDNESLSRAIFAHGYHVQAGLMRMIVREVLGPDAFTSFTFVFVEKAPPYDVRVMQLKDTDIDLGERQARQGLNLLRECLKRNEWPGYDGFDQHISYVEMPAWAKTRIDNDLREQEAA
ncbi:PD-(D/E)XK nuclease-like domain-containing protein [Nitratireductor sp. GCM10026969]|uniref:PD-(D/E)XK nuclease-like domain-containing protein n=1 Tax=Nitratireductor sp. GCM10026969 TaxID=3252645 RepID=UPI0036157C23